MVWVLGAMVVVTVALAAFVLLPLTRPRMFRPKAGPLNAALAQRINTARAKPDAPISFGYRMAWFAIRTRDQQRLVNVLHIKESRPANWQSGIRAIYDDAQGENRVFISPPVNGWTFVAGLPLPYPMADGFVDKWTPMMLALGAEFMDVQFFVSFPSVDLYGWGRVTNNRVVRLFAISDEGVIRKRGRMTKEERAIGLRAIEAEGDAGAEQAGLTEDHVMQIAGRWGLDPTRLADVVVDEAGERGLVCTAPRYWRPARLKSAA
ncbi:MAG: hypothetical protein AAFR04_00975 [Pseudomonadota bacterium]